MVREPPTPDSCETEAPSATRILGGRMRIEPVTSPGAVRTRLLALIQSCDSFSLASAWVTHSNVFDAVIAARRKLKRFVIGTHRYVTCADCLQACVPLASVKVMFPTGPMFHPKVYAFFHDDRTVVYVGSSNFTDAGFRRNVECGVFLSGDPDHVKLQTFVDFIEERWRAAEKLDGDFVASYRANQARVKDAQAALCTFIPLRKPKRSRASANNIAPIDMDWPEFMRRVRGDKTHGVKKRLRVLARARELFSGTRSFAQLSEYERRCLSGVQKPSEQPDGLDWGYFGQMSAHGSYSPIVNFNAKAFSRALDCIPLVGNVERRHYNAYCDALYEIKGASTTWVGMGTRLLAMKRPDRFVCIDGPNRDGLCDYFGVARTTTRLDNYWDRFAEPMTLMPWWQADMPDDLLEQQVWLGRAAMLDAIYYDPSKRRP